MYFKLLIMCILNALVLNAEGLKLFSFYNRNKRLRNLRSTAVLSSAPIQTRWINQKVDHFDTKETRTWKMRYFKRMDYWKKNGPIYFIIGGESTENGGTLTTEVILEFAKETNGALFLSEHRYYGQSQPIKNRTIPDMEFLTTPQALADIAKLIRKIKKNVRFRRSKIVLVGASYAGNLAAWMKSVYPNLVDAAIASSAPVLAKRDFYESLEVITDDYKKYGTVDCLANIRSIFQKYDSLFQTKEGITKLKKEENICEEVDLTIPENKIVFFAAKIDVFVENAQDGNIVDIKNHCSEINETHNVITGTGDEEYWFKKGNCNAYDFNIMVHSLRNDVDEFSWIYQTCTEYGYFFSTTSDKQPFTKNLPVEFNDKLCTALYGDSFDKDRVIDGVEKTNLRYGGRSPNVTEVVFVNGELDPWSSLSILQDISPRAQAVYISKASHCNDLVWDETDSQELRKARTYIKSLIKKWINDPKPTSIQFNLSISVCNDC